MFDSSKIKTASQLAQELSEQQAAAEQAQELADFRASRQALLDSAVVETTSGNLYDADEVSITRMSNGVIAAIVGGKSDTDIIEWSLADTDTGVMTDVSLSDLKEALALAVINMGEVWGR